MNTFNNDQYSITTSLNERTIHIKIINNMSYMVYEGNFDSSCFKLPFSLNNTYNLINTCFDSFIKDKNENPKANIQFALDNGILKLGFVCVIDLPVGGLNIEFDIRLKEKLMSNDAQLTINLQRMEQDHKKEIQELRKQIEDMSFLKKKIEDLEKYIDESVGMAEICFNPVNNQYTTVSFPINTKEISFYAHEHGFNSDSYKKIQYFTKLETLTLYNCNNINILDPNMKNMKSNTLKTLLLFNTHITCNFGFIKHFPNLEEFKMSNSSTTFTNINLLKSIPNKIKLLEFTKCANIGAVQAELTLFCTNNNIKLIIV